VRVAGLLLVALLGCGTSPPEPGSPSTGGYPAPGAPLTGLAPGSWSWIDFPDSSCDDGSPTGIAVSPGTGSDLVVFLNGGGACWDYFTCYVANTAAHGPFGAAQFQELAAARLPGSLLDRSLAGNPLAAATQVFVPYCTGDIHGGDSVVTYRAGTDSRVHHHTGRPNLIAFLRRLAATWPAPGRLVVSGASAGGYGAILNYDAFRHYWPAVPSFLVDDSGPPLGPAAVPGTLLAQWFASWRLDRVLDEACGPPCRSDLSALIPALAGRYPQDRLALLSSLQDRVIAAYVGASGAALEAELLRVEASVIAPTANFRAFLVAGDTHTMLVNPTDFTQGVPLLEWLGQELDGSAAWSTRKP